MKSERAYQAKVIKKIQKLFPDCFVMKTDAAETQGIPDVLILFKNTWAMLEFKRSAKAKIQPNQEHYVKRFGKMSFASFIHPENEEQVLNELQSAFGARR